MKVVIRPSPGPGGAEVECGALQSIDDEAFGAIHRAFLDHLVLVFRAQALTGPDFLAFSRRFGPLQPAPVGPRGAAGEGVESPVLHVVSNVLDNGIPTGILGSFEVPWHADMTSFEVPPIATLLHAKETPNSGGDTFFMNLYLAHDTLDARLRARIAGLTIKHVVQQGSSGAGTGASHPIVCTHPETGCNALFLGARENTVIDDLPEDEGEELLAALWDHVIQWRFLWRHAWRPGDLVVWDNRAVLHARESFDPGARRVLHRTQVQGTTRPSTALDALLRPPHPRGLG